MKESDRKQSSLINMEGETNKWKARMTILVSLSNFLVFSRDIFVNVVTLETITNHISLSSPPNTYQALVKREKYNFCPFKSFAFILKDKCPLFLPHPVLRVLSLFQNPSKSDTGDYKCSVKNKWGNDHTTFNLG